MRGELISYYDYSSGLRLSWMQLWTWQRLICHGCAVRLKIKRPSKNHNVLKILPKNKTLRFMPRRGAWRRWQNWAKPSWKGFSELAFTKDWYLIWNCKLLKVKLMHFPINTKTILWLFEYTVHYCQRWVVYSDRRHVMSMFGPGFRVARIIWVVMTSNWHISMCSSSSLSKCERLGVQLGRVRGWSPRRQPEWKLSHQPAPRLELQTTSFFPVKSRSFLSLEDNLET